MMIYCSVVDDYHTIATAHLVIDTRMFATPLTKTLFSEVLISLMTLSFFSKAMGQNLKVGLTWGGVDKNRHLRRKNSQ